MTRGPCRLPAEMSGNGRRPSVLSSATGPSGPSAAAAPATAEGDTAVAVLPRLGNRSRSRRNGQDIAGARELFDDRRGTRIHPTSSRPWRIEWWDYLDRIEREEL